MNQHPAKSAWTATPFYYGWVVLTASAIIELLVTGATSFAAGLFVLPLQAEFHLSRADANSPLIILFLGAGLCSPIAGRMLDRFPIRPVMYLAAILFCGSLTVVAWSSSLWLMAVILFLPAAFGMQALTILNTTTLVSRWFSKHRGLALGIATIATSGGGYTVVPLMARAIRDHGWRTALLYEAAISALIILLLTLLFIRGNPSDMGLDQDPEVRDRREPPVLAHAGGRIMKELRRSREILASRAFWAPTLLYSGMAGLAQGIVVSAVPYGVQLGISAVTAAWVISAFSLTATLAKILAGILSDMLDKRIILMCAAASMIASLTLLSTVTGFGALLAACGFAGAALGGTLPTAAALIATRFGAWRFGATMGWTFILNALFSVAAMRIAGTIFDRSGSYHGAFVIFLAFCGTISLAALALEYMRPRTV